MKYLRLLLVIFWFSQVFSNADLEQSARNAACQGYDEDFAQLVEMIYGKGFLSQGGKASVEQMVCNLDMQGRKVLDIGSGLGGPAIYLAEKYQVDVTGIDPQGWMIEHAKKNLEGVALKGSLSFLLMENPSNFKQFPDDAFDIIFSRETFLHVPMELDEVAYNLITPSEYLEILKNVGFVEIRFENTSLESAEISEENIETVKKFKIPIETKYGNDIYEYCIESWGYQRDAFKSEELITGIISAKKHLE